MCVCVCGLDNDVVSGDWDFLSGATLDCASAPFYLFLSNLAAETTSSKSLRACLFA